MKQKQSCIPLASALVFAVTGTAAMLGAAHSETTQVRLNSPHLILAQASQPGLGLNPPFYDGRSPLSYRAMKKPIGSNEMITVQQDFGEWRNSFTYDNSSLKWSGVADGARTTDSSGRVLAVAKLTNVVEGKGIEVEETHYGSDGKEIFRCRTFIEFQTGFKVKETDVRGRKEREYYFLWLVDTF